MTVKSISTIEHTVHQTQEWLDSLADQSGLADAEQAYAGLRAVLHALRDRLRVGEATDAASQLPLLIRGMYYEGWKPAQTPQKLRSVDEFIESVTDNLRGNPDIDAPHAIEAVFHLLDEKLTEGQVEHLKHALPEEIRAQLWA